MSEYKDHIVKSFDDDIERDDIRNQIDFDHGLNESFRRHHVMLLTVSFNQTSIRKFIWIYTHFQHYLRYMHSY